MPGLVYDFSPERIILAMDTCSICANRKYGLAPGTLSFPMIILPHLNAVLCGIGDRIYLHYLAVLIQDTTLSRDAISLTNFCQQKLMELKQSTIDSSPSKPKYFQPTTIFLFGHCRTQNALRGIRFFTDDGFQPVEVKYGFNVFPLNGLDKAQARDAVVASGIEAGFVDTMKKMKVLDESVHFADRCGIGGEVHLLELTATSYHLRRIHRFDDYEELYREVAEGLKSGEIVTES